MNRFVHVCQSIDFETAKIETVADGFVEDIAYHRHYWTPYWNKDNPLTLNHQTITNHLLIGGFGHENGKWLGKLCEEFFAFYYK